MPYVTRMLGTGDYGSADLIQQTANVLIPIVFLQINSACLRFALDKNEDKGNVFTIGIRVTLLGFVVFLLFAPIISIIKVNDFNLGNYIVLIYAFVLVSGFRQLCQQFVRGCGKVTIFAVDGILATATTLVFNLLFLGPFHWGVTGYVVAIIASDACSVLFLFVTCKLWRYVKIKGVTKGVCKEMLKYSIPMMPSIILWWVINVSDRYMVTYFIGSAANGLYTAASKIPNFIIMFSSIFIDAWQLSAVDEYDNDGKGRFFTNVFRVYSGGVFAAASGLIVFCQLITKILVSSSYYDSWQYVPILIISTTLSCFVNFLASVYMASKKTVMGHRFCRRNNKCCFEFDFDSENGPVGCGCRNGNGIYCCVYHKSDRHKKICQYQFQHTCYGNRGCHFGGAGGCYDIYAKRHRNVCD